MVSEEDGGDCDVFGLTTIVVAAASQTQVAGLAPLLTIGVAHDPVLDIAVHLVGVGTIADN